MPERMKWHRRRLKGGKRVPVGTRIMSEQQLWAESRRQEVYSITDDDFMYRLDDKDVLEWFGKSGFDVLYWLEEGNDPNWRSDAWPYANGLRRKLSTLIYSQDIHDRSRDGLIHQAIRFGLAPTDGMGPYGDLLKLENDDTIFLEIDRWTGEPEVQLPEGYVTEEGETTYRGLEEFLYGRHYYGEGAKERHDELLGAEDEDDLRELAVWKEIIAVAAEIRKVEEEERR